MADAVHLHGIVFEIDVIDGEQLARLNFDDRG
jgi:hypothetical protein